MAGYAKLKKLHPSAKVRSIKRLISALRKMDHVDLAHERARTDPPKINGRKITDAQVERSLASVARIGKSRMPISFSMGHWLSSVPPESFFDDASCGAAACIAGLAGALAAREPKKEHADLRRYLEKAIDMDDPGEWTKVLAEYLGVDRMTASFMTTVFVGESRGVETSASDRDTNLDVAPRHAARLLEKFLETGKVDWIHAMGRNSNTRELTQKERKERKLEEAQLEAAFEKAEAAEAAKARLAA